MSLLYCGGLLLRRPGEGEGLHTMPKAPSLASQTARTEPPGRRSKQTAWQLFRPPHFAERLETKEAHQKTKEKPCCDGGAIRGVSERGRDESLTSPENGAVRSRHYHGTGKIRGRRTQTQRHSASVGLHRRSIGSDGRVKTHKHHSARIRRDQQPASSRGMMLS